MGEKLKKKAKDKIERYQEKKKKPKKEMHLPPKVDA